MDANFQKTLLEEIALLFEPLAKAAKNVEYRRDLFSQIGWNLAALPDVEQDLLGNLEVFLQAYETVLALVKAPPRTLPELKAACEALKPTIAAVKSLKTAFDDVAAAAPYLDDLIEDLLQHLLLKHLGRRRPGLHRAAELLTLIEISPTQRPTEPIKNADGQVIISPRHARTVRLDKLGPLLSDPAGVLSSHYLPNDLASVDDAATASDLLFPLLAQLVRQIGFDAVYGVAPGAKVDLGQADPALIKRMLSVSADQPIGQAGLLLGSSLLLLSKAEGGPALAVSPRGAASLEADLEDWSLSLKAQGAPNAFVIGPNGVAMADGAAGLKIEAKLQRTSDDEDGPLMIGGVDGTRLEVGRLGLSAGFSVGFDEDVEAYIAAEAGAAVLVLRASDGDGFLREVLPGEIRLPFDLGVEWSRSRGLRLKGGVGLESSLAVKRSLGGVLDIDTLNYGVRASEDGAVVARASLTATVRIGPVCAAVEEVGIEARLKPAPKGQAGALGPLDLDVSFKPPSGVGLSIAAGPVTGGGYLFFDPEQSQYAGALQLELGGKIALGAVGLLTTKIGDGGGFSLFVLISAEFAPMQLGYGFTLNGVGGLIGVNRTAAVDVLRDGVRTGALGSVLFPKDPAKNAPQIISNLNGAFPAAADRVLVGPMAKLGWGTPRILSLDIGLVLEMPSPVRLMLLGRLQAILPSQDKPLVRLQMDALGVLDFDRKEVSLDATLYDSKILEFVLTGDMALRASWGSKPSFLLAIGGFNPRFRPPAAFPKLNRLALSLEQGSSLKLRLETYLALTSNTAQFGARADLQVKAAGFTVDAYLYFDALFQFEPFAFVVDIGAMAALKYKGHNLVGVKFDMSLSGPTPWHVRGKASLEIFCFDVTVDFDHTFGRRQAPSPPRVSHIRPLLLEALRDTRNWSGLDVGHPLVRLREADADGALLLHPLAAVSFSQRVAPLDQDITRFGATRPADGGRYSLEVTAADGASLDGIEIAEVTDAFAPAQFRDMSDMDKLSAPAFETMRSGLRLASDSVEIPYDPALDFDIRFETVVHRTTDGPATARLTPAPLPATLLDAAADAGAAARARGRVSAALAAA